MFCHAEGQEAKTCSCKHLRPYCGEPETAALIDSKRPPAEVPCCGVARGAVCIGESGTTHPLGERLGAGGACVCIVRGCQFVARLDVEEASRRSKDNKASCKILTPQENPC